MYETIDVLQALLNDHIDIINVKASRCHVRSHEDCVGAGPAELVQNVQSRVLHQVAMKAAKPRIALALIELHLNLRIAEDKDLEVAILHDELLYALLLRSPILAEHDLVADRVGHLNGVFPHQVNHQRVLHVFCSDLLNVLGHGRRKDHRLCVRHVALNLHDVLLEAHVKHLVALVQDLELGATYVQ